MRPGTFQGQHALHTCTSATNLGKRQPNHCVVLATRLPAGMNNSGLSWLMVKAQAASYESNAVSGRVSSQLGSNGLAFCASRKSSASRISSGTALTTSKETSNQGHLSHSICSHHQTLVHRWQRNARMLSWKCVWRHTWQKPLSLKRSVEQLPSSLCRAHRVLSGDRLLQVDIA